MTVKPFSEQPGPVGKARLTCGAIWQVSLRATLASVVVNLLVLLRVRMVVKIPVEDVFWPNCLVQIARAIGDKAQPKPQRNIGDRLSRELKHDQLARVVIN